MAKRKSEMKRSHHHEMSSDFHAHHEHLDHFPTAEELREMDTRWGIDRSLDPAEFGLRFERHISRADWTASTSLNLGLSVEQIKVKFNPWIIKVILALMRRRKNHLTFDNLAQNQFNQALQAAHADGSYQALSAVHSQNHMMHSSMGPTGTQRFLPWHREYLFQLEDVLRQKQPGVTIPYWDYANDHARPDWVWKPPNVVRNTPGMHGGSLPTQTTVDSILLKSSYTQFTSSLETGAHNQVHNWCNGTITSPSTASQDPIFFLLHANVDRIWDIWQLNHNGIPTLPGSDAVLDPWQPVMASDVNDVINMAYSYA